MNRSEVEITVDRSRCALCGEPNECALAKEAGAKASPRCWCVGQSFPESLLARATGRDGGDCCICRRCLERARSESSQ